MARFSCRMSALAVLPLEVNTTRSGREGGKDVGSIEEGRTGEKRGDEGKEAVRPGGRVGEEARRQARRGGRGGKDGGRNGEWVGAGGMNSSGKTRPSISDNRVRLVDHIRICKS